MRCATFAHSKLSGIPAKHRGRYGERMITSEFDVDPPDGDARPCPVCGSLADELVYEQRFASFSAGSISDGYSVVVCRDCGMCFATGLPKASRFTQYYADSSKYDLGANGREL